VARSGARPDRARVGYVTCARWPALSTSDALVARALEARGVTVVPVPWNAPGPDPSTLDALVLRANGDYHFTPEAFSAWLDGLERAGRRVWNPPALVRWNLSKRYLCELTAAGLPAVETVVLDAPDALPGLLRVRGWRSAVVKPLISASAHDTLRVDEARAPVVVYALRAGALRYAGHRPAVRRGDHHGRRVVARVREGRADPRRAQAPGGGRVPRAASPRRHHRGPRGSGRRGGGGVNEPGLFFDLAPAAAERFAVAIVERLRA